MIMELRSLNNEETLIYSSQYSAAEKSTGTAYILFIFLSLFAAHRFYMEKYGTAVLYMFTLGGVGFWMLWDLFTLPRQIRKVNDKTGKKLIGEIIETR